MSAEKISYDLKRFAGIKRDYTDEEVERLRGSIKIEYSLCKNQSQKLWKLLNSEAYVNTLGSLSGNQAVQHAKAGLKAIYLSGWQVAADANLGETTYPDQSLYPSNSAPNLAKRINNALLRAEQVDRVEGKNDIDYLVPIVADGEAGFGGTLNVFELTKKFIEAGAAAIHFEDQLAAEKKCGHMGGKVLVPTSQHIRTLTSARLAADTLGVPTVIIARTDALAANLITSDIDETDSSFVLGDRTSEGFFKVKNGPEAAISRGLSYAPYADLVWCETGTPDIGYAKDFADAGDPDQDGIPNLMEYAMGTHPLEQNTAQVSMSHSPGAIAIQYPVVKTRSDVSLIPETSASLETSEWSEVSAITIDIAGSKRMREASLSTSLTKGFLRLRAVEE